MEEWYICKYEQVENRQSGKHRGIAEWEKNKQLIGKAVEC